MIFFFFSFFFVLNQFVVRGTKFSVIAMLQPLKVGLCISFSTPRSRFRASVWCAHVRVFVLAYFQINLM